MNVFNHANEQVRKNAVRTKQITSMTLVGPFELAQGGLGILTRQSIIQNDHFWGFASVVLDVPPILQEAGLFRDKGIDLAVRADRPSFSAIPSSSTRALGLCLKESS